MSFKMDLGNLERKNFLCHPHGQCYLRSLIRLFCSEKLTNSFWKVKADPVSSSEIMLKYEI